MFVIHFRRIKELEDDLHIASTNLRSLQVNEQKVTLCSLLNALVLASVFPHSMIFEVVFDEGCSAAEGLTYAPMGLTAFQLDLNKLQQVVGAGGRVASCWKQHEIP